MRYGEVGLLEYVLAELSSLFFGLSVHSAITYQKHPLVLPSACDIPDFRPPFPVFSSYLNSPSSRSSTFQGSLTRRMKKNSMLFTAFDGVAAIKVPPCLLFK
jgi:hypothetical protein